MENKYLNEKRAWIVLSNILLLGLYMHICLSFCLIEFRSENLHVDLFIAMSIGTMIYLLSVRSALRALEIKEDGALNEKLLLLKEPRQLMSLRYVIW